MAKTLTAKQRAFVAEYAANGGNAAAAYRVAYQPKGTPFRINEMAQKLTHNPFIRPYITKIREDGAAAVEKALATSAITKASLAIDISRLFKLALAANEVKDAVATGTLLAKLSGWVIERRDVRVIKSLHDLSDEELAAIRASAEKEAADLAASGAVH